jgi:hypothetical protein
MESGTINTTIMSRIHSIQTKGFALPSVLIASIVMLIVLLSALTAASSINVGLRGLSNDRLLGMAMEAGAAHAKACIQRNSNNITWNNATPLKPNTNCAGTELVACTLTSTDERCFVANDANTRSSYRVFVTLDSDGILSGYSAEGIVNELRNTSGQLAQRNARTLNVSVTGLGGGSPVYTPY